MKKTYISPSVEIININGATHLMVGSDRTMQINSGSGTEINTSEGGGVNQLGRDNIGSSSVWDQEW